MKRCPGRVPGSCPSVRYRHEKPDRRPPRLQLSRCPRWPRTRFTATSPVPVSSKAARPAKAPAIRVVASKRDGPIVGSAAVADGVVYIASLSSYLYAIDQQSGEKKWEFKSRDADRVVARDCRTASSTSCRRPAPWPRSTPRPASPRWVFPAEFEKKFEAKGLHGYPNAGQVIPDAWDIYTSSPAVANGKVYFGTGDGNVYAVDAKRAASCNGSSRLATSCMPSPCGRAATRYSSAATEGQLLRARCRHRRCRNGRSRPAAIAVMPQPGRLPVIGRRGRRHGLRRLPLTRMSTRSTR